MIELLDGDGNPLMSWTLNNAWPTKITATDVTAEGAVAIETMEIMYEGLKRVNNK